MSSVRKPAVAGMFYTSSREQLIREVSGYIEQAEVESVDDELLGVISPHAGFMYSGLCAGYAFKALKQKEFDTSVVIAPSHRVGGFDYSVGDYSAYRTPIGDVKTDYSSIEQLLQHKGVDFFPVAHEMEHSLEVQLPFLQVINPHARLVPIVIGNQSYANARQLADILLNVFGDRISKTAFIVSSDLSHYHSDSDAETLDRVLINDILNLDSDSLRENIERRRCEACGFGGILTLLHMADQLGYHSVKELHYTHSGHASGDFMQVVGYLSAAIYR